MLIRNALKNSAYILIPTLLFIILIQTNLFQWPRFSLPTSLYYKVFWRNSFLLGSDFQNLAFFLTLAGVIFMQSLNRIEFRKAVALIGLTGVTLYFFSFIFLLLSTIPFFLLYNSLRFAPTSRLKSRGLLILGLALLLAIYAYTAAGTYMFFLLFGQILMGLYSAHTDQRVYKITPSWQHCWILWFCYPGGFFTILYRYKDFATSFFNEDYNKIAKNGATQIFVGVLQLLATQMMQILIYPNYSLTRNKIANIQTPESSTFELWSIGGVLLVFFIAEQVATINVLQGITKIFGYNVPNQVQKVWLATSFLEMWKRASYNTRNFMMTYFFMPTLLRTRNLYISNAVQWFTYGAVASIAYGGLNWYYIKPDSPYEVWILTSLRYGVLFGAGSCMEMALSPYFSKNANPLKKWLYKISMHIAVYVIFILGIELGPNPTTDMNEIFQTIGRLFW